MKVSFKTYSSQTSLIGSIIFLCLGGILFTKADAILDILAVGLGVIIAVFGTVNLVEYGSNNTTNKNSLVVGIISIIIALIFILFHDIVEQFIRFIIGGWILFTGVMRLTNALYIGINNKKSLSLFIVAIALIIIGFYTIIKEGIFLSTVGLVMMIYSIVEIIGYIFYSKEDMKEEDEKETLIIPEDVKKEEPKKETKKATKVKDAKEFKDSKEDKTKKTTKKKTTTKKKKDEK